MEFACYVRALERCGGAFAGESAYLNDVPAIRALTTLDLSGAPVTFFVGENGSGKSTLLEAVAIAAGCNPEGGSRHQRFATADTHAALHERLRLIRGAGARARRLLPARRKLLQRRHPPRVHRRHRLCRLWRPPAARALARRKLPGARAAPARRQRALPVRRAGGGAVPVAADGAALQPARARAGALAAADRHAFARAVELSRTRSSTSWGSTASAASPTAKPRRIPCCTAF